MALAMQQLGHYVAPQRPAEQLLDDWHEGKFTSTINFVKYNGSAFQDVPFSLPGTFKIMDQHFPNAKFILTVRNDPDEWYRSLTKFHAQMFGDGEVPNSQQLKAAQYIRKGYAYDFMKWVYKTSDEDIYNKELLTIHYTQFNREVVNYFENKTGKLMVINLKAPDAAQKLSEFLATGHTIQEIPWENKTNG